MRLRLVIACLALGLAVEASAADRMPPFDSELQTASRAILEGRVRSGIDRLFALFAKLDKKTEPDKYWSVGVTLVEFLHQTENFSEESHVLDLLTANVLDHSDTTKLDTLRFYVGRNFAFTDRADDGEKFLRAVTGGYERLVHSPLQRAAARVLAQIEFDRGNIEQASIWTRRAVIGVLVDKGSSSEEVADTLTDYARFLRGIRRLPESLQIFAALAPLYDGTFVHRSSEYLAFTSEYLETLRTSGDFEPAENIHKTLKDDVSTVDLVGESIRQQLFYQELYGEALKSPPSGNPAFAKRLKQISEEFEKFVKQPYNAIVFCYFAMAAGDVDLAEKFLTAAEGDPPTPQLEAYELTLRASIAAFRNQIDKASELTQRALTKFDKFHYAYAKESATRFPNLSFEERIVLGSILSRLADQVSNPEQGDVVFRLQQFLNRDKAKISLSARVSRQSLLSELEREDVRTRDRLKDLRERLMEEATRELLLNRTLPVRPYAPSDKNDYAWLIRLEEIEEKIASVDAAYPDLYSLSNDTPLSIEKVKELLKQDEVLITHVVLAQQIVSTCVSFDGATFQVKRFDQAETRQLLIDQKLVTAALRAYHEPSITLDSSFPAEESFHLYEALLGNMESCIRGKRLIFLATDADLLVLPWNALLSEKPDLRSFRHREAAWLVRSHAVSLLPSVSSLRQLRQVLPMPNTRRNFLGIGDPDFKGTPDPSANIALAPLTNARGLANREEIMQLPRLPESAAELRDVAGLLGESPSGLLLGIEASERGVRARPLNDYRVISFATHALVAGEIEGATEPALVLTPGTDPKNTKNDGLLTASEIADLTLDTNLVILSACNTAAPDGRINGRGLSGLADAFFFAGARAIAVTQWPVFSDAAQALGTGLVSHSIGQESKGVAEGLRQSMLEYISSRKEDFLAHPRFWASYLIAGDGAISPTNTASKSNEDIQLVWEDISNDPKRAEFLGLAIDDSGVALASGMQMPPDGRQHVGSYIAEVRQRNINFIRTDHEVAVDSIRSFKSGIAIAGSYPSLCTSCPQGDGQSSAVFRLLDSHGNQKWEVVQPSSVVIMGEDIVETPNGYVLVALEADPNSDSSSLILTAVSDKGVVTKQQRIVTNFVDLPLVSNAIRAQRDGSFLIAVSGETEKLLPQGNQIWTDPRTGAKRFSCAAEDIQLVSVDLETLAIKKQVTHEGAGRLTRLTGAESAIYATIVFKSNCRLESSARVVEIKPDLKTTKIFELEFINSLEVTDFIVGSDQFVLVGGLQTFLPSVLAREIKSADEYTIPDLGDESIWDNETIGNAVIIVVNRDGKVEADKVINDTRSRRLYRLASIGSGHFIANGSALGDRGWIAEFTLNRPTSNRQLQ
jgi:CHAT domain-containing protein